MDIKNIIKNKIGDRHIFFNIIKDNEITFVSSTGSVSVSLEDVPLEDVSLEDVSLEDVSLEETEKYIKEIKDSLDDYDSENNLDDKE